MQLGLALMVKDEAAVFARCVASARPLVEAWAVADTGSSDGTPALARELLSDLPGVLVEQPWQDYGTNRTALLEVARESHLAEYWLLLDADETVSGGPVPCLDADAYQLEMTYPPLTYWVPRLVRSEVPWRYRSRAHEYLWCEQLTSIERLGALRLYHHADGANHAGKLERELALLSADWADHHDARTAFYLARTYEDMGHPAQALEWYGRRKGMGGYDEEVWFSWYGSGRCWARLGQRDRAIAELLDAVQVRPWRAEPLRALAQLFADERSSNLAAVFARVAEVLPYPESDLLFIEQPA
jgi:glycosyltransferase involved in cell wall biosynthesis